MIHRLACITKRNNEVLGDWIRIFRNGSLVPWTLNHPDAFVVSTQAGAMDTKIAAPEDSVH
ncbi:hypothetical protein [Salibacterium qingdaonense]|uniref:hypothetical protein n=1 Tax=Salibacterium qingdaonense TaxID=266892 RepID=UPI0011605E8B|nr:hypothetical protein [Salibacterium qingdaonense]